MRAVEWVEGIPYVFLGLICVFFAETDLAASVEGGGGGGLGDLMNLLTNLATKVSSTPHDTAQYVDESVSEETDYTRSSHV